MEVSTPIPASGISGLQGRQLRQQGVITDLYGCERSMEEVLAEADPSGELIPSPENMEIPAEPIVFDGSTHLPAFSVVWGGRTTRARTGI